MLILNIDDDIDDREMFCAAIKAVDSMISCVQMDSGHKALEFIAKAEILPDYIFIDINMPKMDGFECVEKIRSIPGTKKISIVMYSTAFRPDDHANFARMGIKYLSKSSRLPDIVESIKKIIYNGG
ncbi:MAG: response regulator [Cyclobacteriaceae bacterium]